MDPPAQIWGRHSALEPASLDARLIETLWWSMLAVAIATILLVAMLLFLGLWRGRARPLGRRASWTMVALGGVALPFAAVAAMVIGSSLIGATIAARPDAENLTVKVHGKLWWWDVRYVDADGADVARTANEIHIPVGRPVRILLASDNVIHSFWPANLQGKTDLIPGQVNETFIEAERPGVFRGQCAEFCGTQHAFMGFLIIAQPPEEFDRWLRSQAQAAHEAQDETLNRGKAVFLRSSCPACHTIRGTSANGDRGPDLTHIAGRRTLAAGRLRNARPQLAGWIADPQSAKPGALMPPTLLSPADLEALTAYLLSLK